MNTRFPRFRTLLLVVAGLAVALAVYAGRSVRSRAVTGAGTGAAGETFTDFGKGFEAAVVYERPDGIYKTVVGDREPSLLHRGGTYPRWSPNGRRIAFVHEDRIMCMTAGGLRAEALTKAAEARSVAWRPDGKAVYFTEGKKVRTIILESQLVQTVAEGPDFFELDVADQGTKLAATVKGGGGFGYQVRAFDLKRAKNWKLGGGCSASLSPDGKLVTNLLRGHRQIALRDWKTGDITRHVDAPPGFTFDNQFWSNHPDWIVSQTEDRHADIYLHRVSDNRSARATFTGDCNRPDLYIYRDAAGRRYGIDK